MKLLEKLKEKSAETLAESIVSIAVFTLLIVVVTSTLSSASKILLVSQQSDDVFRTEYQKAATQSFSGGETADATADVEISVGGRDFKKTIGITYYPKDSGSSESMIAWFPK